MTPQQRLFAKLEAAKLTRNESRLVMGLLAGKTVREVGLSYTSAERAISGLAKRGIIEKQAGKWVLCDTLSAAFSVPQRPSGTPKFGVDEAPATVTAGAAQPAPPATATVAPAHTPEAPPPPHAFTRRPGPQKAKVLALLQVAGHDIGPLLAAATGQGDCPRALLDLAERVAAKRFGG